jgi:hypothetical protein
LYDACSTVSKKKANVEAREQRKQLEETQKVVQNTGKSKRERNKPSTPVFLFSSLFF